MDIQLIKGSFSGKEALELITELIKVKIKFHENKIEKSASEEDIKVREKRIKQLQQNLFEVKNSIVNNNTKCIIESEIKINLK